MLLERERLKRLQSESLNSQTTQITANIAKVSQTRIELEASLSQQESSLKSGQDLKRMEDLFVELCKQIDLIESKWSKEHPGQKLHSSVHSRASTSGSATYMSASENIDALSDRQVLDLQDAMLVEQDEQLDKLAEVVSRQKMMGLEISDELDYQMDLMERAEMGVDGTRGRLTAAQRRLDQVSRQAKEKKYSLIIAILIVILIIVIVVTKR